MKYCNAILWEQYEKINLPVDIIQVNSPIKALVSLGCKLFWV